MREIIDGIVLLREEELSQLPTGTIVTTDSGELFTVDEIKKEIVMSFKDSCAVRKRKNWSTYSFVGMSEAMAKSQGPDVYNKFMLWFWKG